MTARAARRRRPDWLPQRLHGLQRLLQRRVCVKRVGALGRNEGRALDGLPAEVLADASTLLTKLAADWSADGLAMLRTRLRLLRSAQGDPQRAARAGGSLQVEAGSLTMFMDAEREWDRQLGRVPPAAVPAGGMHQTS